LPAPDRHTGGADAVSSECQTSVVVIWQRAPAHQIAGSDQHDGCFVIEHVCAGLQARLERECVKRSAFLWCGIRQPSREQIGDRQPDGAEYVAD
jgi:hypothetical protein